MLHFRYNTVVVLTVVLTVRYKTCPDHSTGVTVVRIWQVTNFFGSLDQTQFTIEVKSETPNSKPQTPNPEPQSLSPKPQTPAPQTLNPKTKTQGGGRQG